MVVRHIVVHRLEHKHKDISHAIEGIRLQAQHILETYFHKSIGDQIDGIRIQQLDKDFQFLQIQVEHFKKVTKKERQEYQERLTRIENLISSLHTLIFEWVAQKDAYYIFNDKRQIVDKLNLIIKTARL